MDLLRRYGIKEVADVTFYEIDNGGTPIRPVLYLDTLKFSNVETSSESIDAKGGKGDASLVSWDVAKEVVFNVEDALFSMKSLSFMFNEKQKISNTPTVNRCNFVQIKQEHEKQLIFEKIDTNQNVIISYEKTSVKTEEFSNELGYPWTAVYPIALPDSAFNVQFTMQLEPVLGASYSVEKINDQWRFKISGWKETEDEFSIDSFMVEFSYEIPEEGYRIKSPAAASIGLIPKKNLLEGRSLKDIRLYSGNLYLEIATDKLYTEQELSSFSFVTEVEKGFAIKKGLYLLSWKVEVDEWHLKENKEIIISANEFPGVYYMTADTWVRDESTGVDSLFQIIIPKVKLLSDQVSIEMSADGDPVVFDFSFQALKPKNQPLMTLIAYESGIFTHTVALNVQSITQEPSLDCFDGQPGTMIEIDLTPILGPSVDLLTVTRPGDIETTPSTPLTKLALIEKPTMAYSFVPIQKVEEVGSLGSTQLVSSGLYVVQGIGKTPVKNNKPTEGPEEPKKEVVTNYLISIDGKALTLFYLDELNISWEKSTGFCEVTGYLEGTQKNVYVYLSFGGNQGVRLRVYGAEAWAKKQLKENPFKFIVNGVVNVGGAIGRVLSDDWKWDGLIALAVELTTFLVNARVSSAEQAQKEIIKIIKENVSNPDLLNIEINGVLIIDM